jgi:VWFA-related protein
MSLMIRTVALISLTVLAFQPIIASQFTLRVGVDLVNVLFTVTDRNGRFVPGLGPEDFRVEEDGEPQEIAYFARESELPLTLALLVDTSPSVEQVLEDEKRTAIGFLRSTLREEDLALVIGFDRTVTLFQDFTGNTEMLGAAIRTLQRGSGTSLYDAIMLASDERLRTETGRKAIILISDGEDTTSWASRVQAIVAAHAADAVIYSISNVLPRRVFGQSEGDIRTLERLSEETGGTVYRLDNNARFEEIFSQISEELRSQYSLAYRSTNPVRDGEYREIEIHPVDDDYRARARRGYYAPVTPDDAQPVEDDPTGESAGEDDR